MNTQQVEIITNYLNMETDYAVIITGKYGTGKTFLYKNILMPAIKEISLPKNAEKKYVPIHISLFGLKSLEDVRTAIIAEIYPLLKSKGVIITKSIFRAVFSSMKFGDIEKFIQDTQELAYGVDNLVICFDDFDRKLDSLKYSEIFGFINSLVENYGAKILIITNEDNPELASENIYKDIREKVIGISINYNPDISILYDSLINSKYADEKVYKDFLYSNKDIILKFVKINNDNLRNLVFFTENFRKIFGLLEKKFQEDKDFSILKHKKYESVLKFSLYISFEYKLGKLDYKKYQELVNQNNLIYGNEFRKVYYEYFNEGIGFYVSILEYFMGNQLIDFELLIREIQNIFPIKDGKLVESEYIIQKLSQMSFLELSDDEYKALTNRMLDFVGKGLYSLDKYTMAFHLATRFNNLLEYNINDLKTIFCKGIDTNFEKSVQEVDLFFSNRYDSKTDYYNEIMEISQYCYETNEKIKKRNKELKSSYLIELLGKNFEEFLKHENDMKHIPFWHHTEYTKVFSIITNMGNKQIYDLGYYFKTRYRKHIYDDVLVEKEFLNNLINMLDCFIKRDNRKNLKNASLTILLDMLKKCLPNFQ